MIYLSILLAESVQLHRLRPWVEAVHDQISMSVTHIFHKQLVAPREKTQHSFQSNKSYKIMKTICLKVKVKIMHLLKLKYVYYYKPIGVIFTIIATVLTFLIICILTKLHTCLS